MDRSLYISMTGASETLRMQGHQVSIAHDPLLALATPAVLWGGWPFFQRGWESIKSRHLNMFTLIALGTGAAYGYSVAVLLFPQFFVHAADGMAGMRPPVYFEAAGQVVCGACKKTLDALNVSGLESASFARAFASSRCAFSSASRRSRYARNSYRCSASSAFTCDQACQPVLSPVTFSRLMQSTGHTGTQSSHPVQ